MNHDFQDDIDRVQAIGAVKTILDVACRATGMRFAAVARVTEDRWIACEVLDRLEFGLAPGEELPVETTLCNEVRDQREVIVFDDASADECYKDHHTPRRYGLSSYISVPIILADGSFFGTLCAIDSEPAKINDPKTVSTFQLFAELIAHHLAAADRIAEAETALLRQRGEAELREQFIAVLGHDLRNPLASVSAGVGLLQRKGWTDAAPELLAHMGRSVSRMAGLIDNLMDFAHARLGDGIPLNRELSSALGDTMQQVVSEIRAAHPEKTIELDITVRDEVSLDRARIGQMVSNLLGNAVTHGDDEQPVRVTARALDGELEISVANSGQPIPADVQARLFEPFFRGGKRSEGLGLGLYIASRIAEAHGGAVSVSSGPEETRFTFRMAN